MTGKSIPAKDLRQKFQHIQIGLLLCLKFLKKWYYKTIGILKRILFMELSLTVVEALVVYNFCRRSR